MFSPETIINMPEQGTELDLLLKQAKDMIYRPLTRENKKILRRLKEQLAEHGIYFTWDI